MKNAIEVKDLTKQYPGFLLDKVSFTVPAGSIVGFIGENGAGKSTTIKAMLGLVSHDAGSVNIFGKDIEKKLRDVKEEIGVVFDENCFPECLYVKDIERMMKAVFRSWERDTFYDCCRRFDLPEKKAVREFSRGMKMKLSIAAAFSHKAKLLIFDEATSGLDPVVRSEILDLLMEFIQEEDHTVFLSSHITSDIEKIADYILLIHEGRILLFENKDTLLYEYGLVRCSSHDADEIEKDQIVGVRRNQFETEVLVRDRSRLQGKSGLVVDRVTLEDILLFMVKGGKTEGGVQAE